MKKRLAGIELGRAGNGGQGATAFLAATDPLRDSESAGEIGGVGKPEVPTIAEAVEKFLADANAQTLSAETILKYAPIRIRASL